MKDKIISRFYVIYGDNIPIYVGYTNRTVQQRFKEHLLDKDFSSYNNIEVKEVCKLAFDFSWDELIVNSNAKTVSDKELELINLYHTNNSSYQRGIGYLLGGQTWSNIKNFVHSNLNNPKYENMSGSEIVKYLNEYRTRLIKLHRFIDDIKDPRARKLMHFISRLRDPRLDKLERFIIKTKEGTTNYSKRVLRDRRLDKLSHFISICDPRLEKLNHFIRICDPRPDKLSNFISHIQDSRIQKLSNFISHIQDPRIRKLSNFISRNTDPRLDKLHIFIKAVK